MDFMKPMWDGLPYPEFISKLPEIDIPIDGVRGWLLQGTNRQLVFLDIEPIGAIPPHSHGDQWGIVVSGEMNLTVDGVTRLVGPGDWYYIPAGAVHSAEFLSRFQVLDFFEDHDRYSPKP